MSLVFLIGMPGAGKSYWGRIWAEVSGFEFVDLDERVVARAGTGIPDIFGRIGEQGFRQLESELLQDTIAAAGVAPRPIIRIWS
jgi:shikimate kinase